jgi:hypothetical protein
MPQGGMGFDEESSEIWHIALGGMGFRKCTVKPLAEGAFPYGRYG